MKEHKLSWIVCCISVLVLFLAGPAVATTINFDDVTPEGSWDFFSADRYRSMGAVFSRDIPIANVEALSPTFFSYFEPGGSVPNALVLAPGTEIGTQIDLTFVVPGTFQQGLTDVVSVDAFDSQLGLMGTLEAYDAEGSLIDSVVLNRSTSRHRLYEIGEPGAFQIARIRFIDTDPADGVYWDNLTFSGPVQTPTPEPSSPLLFGLGAAVVGVALARRRTSG